MVSAAAIAAPRHRARSALTLRVWFVRVYVRVCVCARARVCVLPADAFANVENTHHLCDGAKVPQQCAARMVFNAGGDQEGGGTATVAALPGAVAAGEVAQATMDASFRRLMAARLRLGFHDPPAHNPWNFVKNDSTVVQSAAHVALARALGA